MMQGHCVLEMPSGTGKTVSLFSLIVSYQQVRHSLLGDNLMTDHDLPVLPPETQTHLLLSNSP
jgi:hypothetical protein